jgi:hypothetical protein
MPPRRRTPKDTPAKLARRMKRRWGVVLLRVKGEILGTVEAADVASAKAVAADRFELDDAQRDPDHRAGVRVVGTKPHSCCLEVFIQRSLKVRPVGLNFKSHIGARLGLNMVTED